MARRIGLILVLVAATGGCGKKASSEPAGNFTAVAADDPKMGAAIEKARSTVGTFTTALKTPNAGQSGFSVKVAVVDGGQTEHMWLAPVGYDGQTFRGRINNDPEMVKNVKLGDEWTVEPAMISDWMYVEKRRLVGGYTLRVLRDTMPAGQRAEFERSLPFVID